ncbi:hypothetical protein [Microcystis panniformis]|uniref:Uncharacterized protein n=1 Tax=Microcystis panniformis FACHB-1757 TaxID=1638788 RepID=A0A0K1S3V1_9CHRO|nr:hypothetical protein [Microcystis panniformis]AKV68829.1 hypothetical protein VL20_3868 [Microcystis panniformis FACHB-1757]
MEFIRSSLIISDQLSVISYQLLGYQLSASEGKRQESKGNRGNK